MSTQEPAILLAGRALSRGEAKRWIRLLFDGRKRLPLLAFITILIFVSDMLWSLVAGGYGAYERGIFSVVLAVAIGFMIRLLFRILSTPKKQMLEEFAEYQADTARQNTTTAIALYDERVTLTSIHTTRTLRYDAVTVCVETADGFVLGDGVWYIIIRAADLTPYLADVIRTYITERVDPQIIRVKGAVVARLRQPILPIPHFAEPMVLTTAQIIRPTVTRCSSDVVWFAAAAGLFVAVGVTVWLPFSPWFLVTLVSYAVVAVAAAVGFALLVMRRVTERVDDTVTELSFEADGLRMTVDGCSRFYVKERLTLFSEREGIRIRFANAEIIDVPYRAATNAYILSALAGAPISEEITSLSKRK